MSKFDTAQQLFELVVNKSYLTHLSDSKYFEVLSLDDSSQIKTNDLRWVKIDKLVLEKSVFTPDQLSMVYSSMHTIADTLALLLKKENGIFSLYLGIKDINRSQNKNIHESYVALKYALNGFFPGIVKDEIDEEKLSVFPIIESASDNERDLIEKEDLTSQDEKSVYDISAVSGVGALKDDKKQIFIQGLEKLIEGSRTIDSFSVLFLAERVDSEQARYVIDSYGQLASSLLPLSQRQVSFTQTKSEGITHTLTKSFSESVTNNLGITASYGSSIGKFKSKVDSVNGSLGVGTEIGDGTGSLGLGYGHSWIRGESEGYTNQWGFQESEALTSQKMNSEAEAQMESWAEGITHQFSLQERTIKLYLDLIDKQIKRLSSSIPYGLWNMASYCIVKDSEERSKSLAAIFKGAMVGDDSDVDTVRINYWHDSDVINSCLERCIHPRFKLLNTPEEDNSVVVTPASVVNSKELAIMMPFPQKSVPGIIVREQASFGRNIPRSEDGVSLDLGDMCHLGGRDNSKGQKVSLNLQLLSSHTFITGTTGSGKSNTTYQLLTSLPKDVHFLVIEPAKGEYKNVLRCKDNPIIVYGTNKKHTRLLRINPFSFRDHIHVYEHIESLVGIFNACWPMYAAMPIVLKKSIERAYERCGWDLSESTTKGERMYPSFKDVLLSMNEILASSKYSSDTKSDYRGALETRLMDLSEGLIGDLFQDSLEDCISDKSIFGDKNVIVDLSRVDSSETKSLLMGLLVLKLKEFRSDCFGKTDGSLKHITVLEEAHHLLRRTSTVQVQESSNIAGKAVEMLINGIAELRSAGEGFIIVDQSPALLDPAVIRNTSTKIIHNLPDEDDRQVVGRSIGLSENQIIELGKQPRGIAVVYQNGWEEPVQCYVNYYPAVFIEFNEPDSAEKKTAGIDRELVDFLVFGRLMDNKPVLNPAKIRHAIQNSSLQASSKYWLLSHLSSYESGDPSADGLWGEDNDVLSEIVVNYLDCEAQLQSIAKRNLNEAQKEERIQQLVSHLGLPEAYFNTIMNFAIRSLDMSDGKNSSLFKYWYNKNKVKNHAGRM